MSHILGDGSWRISGRVDLRSMSAPDAVGAADGVDTGPLHVFNKWFA